MDLAKVEKIANEIIENDLPRHYFMTDIKSIDSDRVTKSLLKGIKTLNKEEVEILDLVISVRDDQNLTNMRRVIKEELESIKQNIEQIKKVVGCNGNS